jgi:hypothetical protein
MDRNTWKRLWYAFFACTIRRILFDLLEPLPTHTAPTTSDTDAYTIILYTSSFAIGCCTIFGRCGGRQSCIPQLPYPETGHCWLCSWGLLCSRLVYCYNIFATIGLVRMVLGNRFGKICENARSGGYGRSGGCRLGTLGGEKKEKKHTKRQEAQMTRRSTLYYINHEGLFRWLVPSQFLGPAVSSSI